MSFIQREIERLEKAHKLAVDANDEQSAREFFISIQALRWALDPSENRDPVDFIAVSAPFDRINVISKYI